MPDNKHKFKTCKQRHLPPTGKKCDHMKQQEGIREHLQDAGVSSDVTVSQLTPMESTDGQQVQMQILEQLRRVTERLDSVEDRMSASSQHSTPELSTDSFLESVKSSKNDQNIVKYQVIRPLMRVIRPL